MSLGRVPGGCWHTRSSGAQPAVSMASCMAAVTRRCAVVWCGVVWCGVIFFFFLHTVGDTLLSVPQAYAHLQCVTEDMYSVLEVRTVAELIHDRILQIQLWWERDFKVPALHALRSHVWHMPQSELDGSNPPLLALSKGFTTFGALASSRAHGHQRVGPTGAGAGAGTPMGSYVLPL